MDKRQNRLLTIRALSAAIEDQRGVIDNVCPVFGWDPWPWRANMERLKLRLIDAQQLSLDGELYGDD